MVKGGGEEKGSMQNLGEDPPRSCRGAETRCRLVYALQQREAEVGWGGVGGLLGILSAAPPSQVSASLGGGCRNHGSCWGQRASPSRNEMCLECPVRASQEIAQGAELEYGDSELGGRGSVSAAFESRKAWHGAASGAAGVRSGLFCRPPRKNLGEEEEIWGF